MKTYVHRLSLVGPKRMVMMSDGEASILAWKTHVAAGLARWHGVKVVSSCCGRCAGQRIGGACDTREVKGNTRQLTKQFVELHKVEPKVDHLIHLWQVEFCGNVHQHWAQKARWPDCVGSCVMAALSSVSLWTSSQRNIVSVWCQSEGTLCGQVCRGCALDAHDEDR